MKVGIRERKITVLLCILTESSGGSLVAWFWANSCRLSTPYMFIGTYLTLNQCWCCNHCLPKTPDNE